MSCEIIRVDFKKKTVKSRQVVGEPVPEYNAYQDEHFKAVVAGAAEVAMDAMAAGADPRKMVVLFMDEDGEYDASLYADDVIPTEEVISGLKRAVAKLEMDLQGPGPEPGARA